MLLKTPIILPLFLLGLLVQYSSAQRFEASPLESKLIVFGTSNLHDWTVTSNSFKGTITFNDVTKSDIKSLQLEIPSTSLKSGKNGMDKNTYKALKTDDYANIKFQLANIKSVTPKGVGSYDVEGIGALTITGNTKNIPVKFKVFVNEKNVKLEGFNKIMMTDYGVEPPKALFGTITTGDELKIEYKLIFKTN